MLAVVTLKRAVILNPTLGRSLFVVVNFNLNCYGIEIRTWFLMPDY